MAREFVIVWAGTGDRDPWRSLCDGYAERIRRTVPVREVVVRARRGGESERRRREAEDMEAVLPEPCLRVALDARGRSMTSERFAGWLNGRRRDYPHPIVFLLGSDAGLGDELRRSAELTLAFGPMTLPHELARVVLYEQLYRALAIEQGIKYHREPF